MSSVMQAVQFAESKSSGEVETAQLSAAALRSLTSGSPVWKEIGSCDVTVPPPKVFPFEEVALRGPAPPLFSLPLPADCRVQFQRTWRGAAQSDSAAESDGSPVYLHPICTRMLVEDAAVSGIVPTSIAGTVLEVENWEISAVCRVHSSAV